MNTIKIQHNLDFINSEHLHWYAGLYLGLPRVFMSIVRKKLVYNPNITSILIPLYTVKDPITGNRISINITDRYFFVGTLNEVESELDIGLQTHINTITLLRNKEDSYKPSKITAYDINKVIRTHIQKHRNTIQEDVTVHITGGTFKDWYGVVESKSENPENVNIKFTSDEYNYSTEMPRILCKAAY